ncbi:SAC3/GANP/Nin1/mts3/eIF-3 p25 family-domain-containing protein [Trametes gibbosa]|nr:SAC3/GANP/Nin1/mts3/eIF-3 p25 family-domain-containing protein [Trametes gibbosa]
MMHIQGAADDRRPHSRNKRWVAGSSDGTNGQTHDGERWERGGHRRRGGRGRVYGHHGTHLTVPNGSHEDGASGTEDGHVSGTESAHDEEHDEPQRVEPVLETAEERERFYQELVKLREVERKRAIAEGKMDDPLVPKRLDEAISMVGTCMDMCPRFERYRRERENNLDKWEVIPGTKRVDHERAVKIYERAAGDKTLPSDLRPPPVLKQTLNYLFHDLLMREGFSGTYDFIRDRSRAVRNDFTMQHETGPLAIECHDRCARFHILALHLERESPRFSVALEEQQLMNTLQSLKEFYEDQRGRYQAPTELEMRVYHRLIHIRDQKERHEEIPDDIRHHAVFRLTTQFRQRVQAKSAPISKTSKLIVDTEAMQIFSQLANVLREANNIVMIYLVACILERHFGKDAIEDIENIRGDLSIPDIIDGISKPLQDDQLSTEDDVVVSDSPTALTDVQFDVQEEPTPTPQPITRGATEWLTSNFGAPPTVSMSQPTPRPANPFVGPTSSASSSAPVANSAFAGLGQSSASSSFLGSGSSLLSSTSAPPKSAFGNLATKTSAFAGATFGPSISAPSTSVFGTNTPKSTFGSSTPDSNPFAPPASKSSGSIFSGPMSFGSVAPATKPQAPLTAQPTWPAESSGFANTLQAPPFPASSPSLGPTPPRAPSLNPLASSFVPPFTPQPQSQPPIDSEPAVRPPIFSDPFAASSASAGPSSPSKLSAPPAHSSSLFGGPPDSLVRSSAPSAPAPEEDAGQGMPPPPTPTRIIERRQTLWDLPGSSSPFSRLKEDSMTYTPSPGTPTAPSSPISPTAPPPMLGRPTHIALPPTPTARWFEASEASLSRKPSMIHFPTVQTPSAVDILSPIHLTTPTGKSRPPSSDGLLLQTGTPALERQSTMESLVSISPVAKTPDSATKMPKPVLEIQTNGILPPSFSSPSPSKKGNGKTKQSPSDLKMRAVHFLHTSQLVRTCWARWRKRRETSKAWEDACKRSQSYHNTRLSTSANGRPSDGREALQAKKRRVSSVVPIESVQDKRAKRRKSAQLVAEPLTDEALARRLQENRDENEKRWAQGSFRRTILDCLKARLPPDVQLSEWCIWLSTNSMNDKTAIWLEHKFDVPASGHWVSENVFCIPAFEAPEDQGSPGLIVFERSPLEGVDDEIERKYRVLDDCARLRDILETRPPPDEEHFVPCLLVVNWSEKEDDENTQDFVDMTRKAVRDGSLRHVSYFSVSATAKELDKKFSSVVSLSPLDTDDRLAVKLSWKDIHKFLISPVESPLSDLVDSCWSGTEFDWTRYDRVVVAAEAILDASLRAIVGLFPDISSPESIEIPEDIPQPGDVTQGYATGPFVDFLTKLLASSVQEALGNKLSKPITLPRSTLDAAVHTLEGAIETQMQRLRQLAADTAHKASLGPSPKRPASQEDLRLSGSLSSKRLRTSPSDDELGDADFHGVSVSPPPSTAAATDVGDKPLVTVAMLRALTRDVLKTYGGSK